MKVDIYIFGLIFFFFKYIVNKLNVNILIVWKMFVFIVLSVLVLNVFFFLFRVFIELKYE